MHAQEKQPLGLPDRVVKITGTPDQLLRAVALLLTKLVESPNYTRFTTSNVSYGPPLAPVRIPCRNSAKPGSGGSARMCIAEPRCALMATARSACRLAGSGMHLL